jgi:hypothetical protein
MGAGGVCLRALSDKCQAYGNDSCNYRYYTQGGGSSVIRLPFTLMSIA